jgi:hypothetical protein
MQVYFAEFVLSVTTHCKLVVAHSINRKTNIFEYKQVADLFDGLIDLVAHLAC